MSTPYGGNNPGQWGQGQQQPPANPGTGGFAQAGGYGQQPAWGQPSYGQQPPVANPYEQGAYGQPQGGQYDAYGQPQQGAYGQAPPQQQQPQQYGTPYPGGQPPKPAKSGGKGLWIGLAVAVVVLAAAGVVLFWKPGLLNTTVFDQQSIEGDIQRVLQEGMGVSVESVNCPADQEVKEGLTFTCGLTVNGQQQTVELKVTSDEGHYTVNPPAPKE